MKQQGQRCQPQRQRQQRGPRGGAERPRSVLAPLLFAPLLAVLLPAAAAAAAGAAAARPCPHQHGNELQRQLAAKLGCAAAPGDCGRPLCERSDWRLPWLWQSVRDPGVQFKNAAAASQSKHAVAALDCSLALKFFKDELAPFAARGGVRVADMHVQPALAACLTEHMRRRDPQEAFVNDIMGRPRVAPGDSSPPQLLALFSFKNEWHQILSSIEQDATARRQEFLEMAVSDGSSPFLRVDCGAFQSW